MDANHDIAAHRNPALRHAANFMIFADLSIEGMPGRWEQLWVKKLDEYEFELCCIPFFTYGMALGDRVSTGPKGDKKYVIQSVVSKSGHLVYRVWFGDVEKKKEVVESVESFVRSMNWLFEWNSENLLAVDLPSNQCQQEFIAFLETQKHQKIIVESGG